MVRQSWVVCRATYPGVLIHASFCSLFLHFAVDHVGAALRLAAACFTGASGLLGLFGAGLLVDGCADLLDGLPKRLRGGLDGRDVAALGLAAQVGGLGLHVCTHLGRDLVAEVSQGLLGRIGCVVGVVAG